VVAGIAVAVIACALGALGASSAPRASSASISSTPTASIVATPTATPASTPTPALGLAEPTTGPGGCTIAAPASPPHGLALYVCYTISGTVSASGGFIDEDQGPAALSCADWAENGEEAAGSAIHALQAPDPGDAQVEVNGQALGFDLAIDPYTGPGTYTSINVAQSVSVGESLSWSTNATSAATFIAQLNPDGSGSVTVTNLHDDSSNGTTENAAEGWVCVMATGS
jgi:hypothetical protein